MLHYLWVAIIGLVAGAIAKLLVPGRDPGGIFITMVLGIAGAFLGTWIGRAIGHYGPDEGAGLIMSVVGAVILLLIYHFFRRRQSTV